MVDTNANALNKLQGLSEKDLTLTIIMPLLYSLGYQKIDYFGGVYEEGKDIILWRKDELGLLQLAVAQVKKYRATSRASDDKSFMEIVRQLEVCFEHPVPSSDDGKEYLPSIVYLISPFEIETRALLTRLRKSSSLRSQGLKIIDGGLLLSLIKRHLPEMASNLFGLRDGIYKASMNKLNNATLLRALDFHYHKNLESLYSDLDLAFGNISGEHFLNLTIEPLEFGPIELSEVEWNDFRKICEHSENTFGVILINRPLTEVDEDLSKKRKNLLKEIDQEKVKSKNVIVTTAFSLTFSSLHEFVTAKQEWLIQQLVILNDQFASIKRIKEVLIECQRVFAFLDQIVQTFNKMGLFLIKYNSDNANSVRITMPINRLFNTGLNIAVYGEAGAGKTTCLQILAQRALADISKNVLFLPLTKVFKSYKIADEMEALTIEFDRIFMAIIEYLRSENVFITEDELRGYLEGDNVIAIFDGIDEVIATFPWIIKGITALSRRFLKCQFACSARSGGSYIADIPFFGIRLLPFTDFQRDKFIMGWFEGTSNQNKPSEIIKHLKVNPKLGDIVRSPLLATILCVLAEHGITLPDKEIRLYEERMNLLLGTYDIYKETTRIVTPKYLLGGLARKIAYEFNVNKCREMGLDEIKRRVFRYFSDQDENALTVGLNELIHPCNILEPMSSQVSFGFGHFRYQEFLAATECNVNRAIKVEEQIGSEFWRGTLELFAQITDDIKFLLTYAINKRMVVEARPTLEAVFRVRPEKERVEFTAELRRQLSIAEKYLSDETVSRR